MKEISRLIAYTARGFYNVNRTKIFILSGAALASMIIGIIVGAAPRQESINYMILMSEGNYNITAGFFKTMLSFVVPFLFVFTGALYVRLKPLGIIALGFVCYRCGVMINCCFQEDAAMGGIYLVIYLLPVYLTLTATMVTAIVIVLEIDGGSKKVLPVCMKALKQYGMRVGFCYIVNAPIGIVFMIIVPYIVKMILVV